MKDRPYLNRGKLRIDFGDIRISNQTSIEQGRWQKKPDENVLVTTMKVLGQGFTMSYEKGAGMKCDNFTILPSTNFAIAIERLNYTDKLLKYYLSEGIDFTDLDISQHMKVKFSPFKLSFTKDVYSYCLRCNDLNIGYSDQLQEKF